MWPRGEQGRYQWQIKGDVPYQIETARKLPKAEEYRVQDVYKRQAVRSIWFQSVRRTQADLTTTSLSQSFRRGLPPHKP